MCGGAWGKEGEGLALTDSKRFGRRAEAPNHFLRIGGAVTIAMVLLIALGLVWTPYSPTAMDASSKFLPPGFEHLCGTDNMGRDIFSRIMEGAGTTLLIATGVILIGSIFGTIIGCLTGYFGGLADLILMRVCDAITAFPSVLLALVFVMIFGRGKYQIIVILGVLFIPSFARVVRAEMARQRSLNYVYSARLMGAGDVRIIFRHILPNILPVLLPTISIGFNNAVLAEASMSYVGAGVQPPDASLGRMLSDAQQLLGNAPWYALTVGSTIVLLILGFSMLGEGLSRRR